MKHKIYKTKWFFKMFIRFSCIALFFASCYPGGAEYVEDYDAVYTDYDPNFNFDVIRTYSLPDKVVKLEGEEGDEPEFINEAYSTAILSTVRANLNAMGWTEVSAVANPDIEVMAGAFDQTFISYNPWWWDWYYPWYGPGWGWWYPGYSPGYISGYSSGSVLVQMTYPEGTTSDNEVPVEWMGVLNGLLQGSEANIVARITSGLDDAFNHPPFNN